MKQENDQFSPEESIRRRDEVIRRMANTPPKTHPALKPKRKKPPQSGGFSGAKKGSQS